LPLTVEKKRVEVSTAALSLDPLVKRMVHLSGAIMGQAVTLPRGGIQDPHASLAYLQEQTEQQLRQHPQETEVAYIGHSMGGVISLRATYEDTKRQKIRRCMPIGAPLDGPDRDYFRNIERGVRLLAKLGLIDADPDGLEQNLPLFLQTTRELAIEEQHLPPRVDAVGSINDKAVDINSSLFPHGNSGAFPITDYDVGHLGLLLHPVVRERIAERFVSGLAGHKMPDLSIFTPEPNSLSSESDVSLSLVSFDIATTV
jgi:pimeloyl-ACP methyl ester carboxylesterase